MGTETRTRSGKAAARLCSLALAALTLAAPAAGLGAPGVGARGPARQAADHARRDKVSAGRRRGAPDKAGVIFGEGVLLRGGVVFGDLFARDADAAPAPSALAAGDR